LSVTGPEADVVAGWTERMYAEARAVDHVDLFRAGTRFRVFLPASTLQVDVTFWPQRSTCSARCATRCWRWPACATAYRPPVVLDPVLDGR